jgi:hypothetical protein
LEVVEDGLLRNVPEAPTVAERILINGDAIDEHAAGGRLDEAGEHLRCGALAGSVGAEIADNFTAPNFEVQVADYCGAQEPLGQVSSLQHAAPPLLTVPRHGSIYPLRI